MNYQIVPVCHPYRDGRCRSCTLFAAPPEVWDEKFDRLSLRVESCFQGADVLAPVKVKHPFGSRSKVKLDLAGSALQPQLGLTRRDESGRFILAPLLDCPLHHPQLNSSLEYLTKIIQEFGLSPYDINTRIGELKSIAIVRGSEDLIVRFIARSSTLEDQFRLAAEKICRELPAVKSVSLNLQPTPHQIPEGEEEILLAGSSQIKQHYGEFYLYLSARSFLQVTPEIATALYAAARSWSRELEVNRALDLFCGAGGFLMAVAPPSGVGVELKDEAVAGARRAASEQGLTNLRFVAADVSTLSVHEHFDFVITNPPRRGLGETLCSVIRRIDPKYLLYSSCNQDTLFRDLELLKEFKPIRFQAFDMFPLTEHLEILCLLERR